MAEPYFLLGEKLHQQVHYYLVVVFCITIPFLYRLSAISISLLTLNWLLSGLIWTNFRALLKPLPILFLSFFFIHLVGMIYTSNQTEGWFVIERKLSFLVLPLIFFTTQRFNDNQIKNVIRFYILGNVLSLLAAVGYATYQYFSTNLGLNSFFYVHLVKGLSRHPTYVGLNIGIAILILGYTLLYKPEYFSSKERKAAYVLIPVFLFFLVMLLSRIILLSFGIIAFIFSLFYFLQKKKWMTALFLIIFWGISIFTVSQIPQIKNRLSQVSNDARPHLWSAGVEIIKQNLLFGVGTGDVQDQLLPIYKERKMKRAFRDNYNMHNIFMQVMIMLGLVGLVLFLAILILPSVFALQSSNWLFLMILALFILAGSTEALLERQEGIMLFAFFLIGGSRYFLKIPIYAI